MEKRDICLNYIKDQCEDKERCKYAHVIVENKENFISYYQQLNSKFINQSSLLNWIDSSKNKTQINKKMLTKCPCGKGFLYDPSQIMENDIRGKLCATCVTLWFEDQEAYKKKFLFISD